MPNFLKQFSWKRKQKLEQGTKIEPMIMLTFFKSNPQGLLVYIENKLAPKLKNVLQGILKDKIACQQSLLKKFQLVIFVPKWNKRNTKSNYNFHIFTF